jgi:hypothetical protein
MGEKITIKAIEVIDQPSLNRTLLQLDIWYDDQNKGARIFIDSREFFTMLGSK